jgi:signal transduction histidine kinase
LLIVPSLDPKPSAARGERLRLAIWLCVMVTLLGLIAALCIDLLVAVRAHVAAEGLRARSSKNAVLHLNRYAFTRDPREWQAYQRALRVPLGSLLAREQIDSPTPDYGMAREELMVAGSHPQDVAGMLRLLRWSGRYGSLERALDLWRESDQQVLELRGIAEQLHAAVGANADQSKLRPLIERLEQIDTRSSALGSATIDALGHGSREVRTVLLTALLALAACALLGSVVAARRHRQQRHRLEAELRNAHQTLESRVAERTAALERDADRLRDLDRLKSDFISTVNHGLRNPLNSIIGFTDLLRIGAAGPLNDRQREQVSMVHDAALHLLSLVNNVLELSRIESGAVHLENERFDFVEVVEAVSAQLRPLAQKKGLQFETAMPASLLLQTDRRRCHQILHHLVGNAIRFTQRGTVRIEAAVSENQLAVSVIDTGIGLTTDQLNRLFQRFQPDEIAGLRQEVRGLGLYLTSRLLELMDGSISVESVPGQGSRFKFALPLKSRVVNLDTA